MLLIFHVNVQRERKTEKTNTMFNMYSRLSGILIPKLCLLANNMCVMAVSRKICSLSLISRHRHEPTRKKTRYFSALREGCTQGRFFLLPLSSNSSGSIFHIEFFILVFLQLRCAVFRKASSFAQPSFFRDSKARFWFDEIGPTMYVYPYQIKICVCDISRRKYLSRIFLLKS